MHTPIVVAASQPNCWSVAKPERATTAKPVQSMAVAMETARPTVRVAVSAAALLARAADRDRVKICPGDDCGWMFLDESRNRRRTWCAMDMCGNRAKARRHYQRKTGRA